MHSASTTININFYQDLAFLPRGFTKQEVQGSGAGKKLAGLEDPESII